MPRYNLRTLRGERIVKKKEGNRMVKWKSEYERFVNDSRNVFSVEEVREEILLVLEDNAIEQTKVSLICPASLPIAINDENIISVFHQCSQNSDWLK